MMFGLIFTLLSLQAKEISLEYEIKKDHIIKLYKEHVEEPVSTPYRLRIVQVCPQGQKELFNKKKCNFDRFKLKKDALEFKSYSYDPHTGGCKKEATKDHRLTIRPDCS